MITKHSTSNYIKMRDKPAQFKYCLVESFNLGLRRASVITLSVVCHRRATIVFVRSRTPFIDFPIIELFLLARAVNVSDSHIKHYIERVVLFACFWHEYRFFPQLVFSLAALLEMKNTSEINSKADRKHVTKWHFCKEKKRTAPVFCHGLDSWVMSFVWEHVLFSGVSEKEMAFIIMQIFVYAPKRNVNN